MRSTLFFLAFFLLTEGSICQVTEKKIIMADGNNSLEFSPFNSGTGSLLIEPINRVTGKGVPGIFYLSDTSSWNFYTNGRQRLSLKGDGNITASGPLLINGAAADNRSSLRINGTARIDTSLLLQASSDSNSFISFDRTIKSSALDPDDKFSAYAGTPTTWGAGRNIPVFRLRHPNNVANVYNINTSLQRDFKIYPYQYGIAIDYNGVVECWVGEWSIHRGLWYNDVEGKGNGWGAVFWVGDDNDLGGLRAVARNNNPQGGNVAYGELSVEKFAGAPNGDLRLRLPSTQNQFQFVYGERGSTNIVAKISDKGFYLPKISAATLSASPEAAQIAFDSTDKKFKAYNGTQWIPLDESIKTGSYTLSSNGSGVVFNIPHGLGTVPSYFNVIATSAAAANVSYVTADALNLVIHYSQFPAAGTNNLSWNWEAKK